MYNTSFDDDLRYVVICITNGTVIKLVETIVDTGAKRTCYGARMLDDTLSEDAFLGVESILIGGFIEDSEKGNFARFYRYHIKQFTIGNIDLGEQDVWITFDQRVKDNVLGMDILQKVCMLQYENENVLYFFKDRQELKEYVAI